MKTTNYTFQDYKPKAINIKAINMINFRESPVNTYVHIWSKQFVQFGRFDTTSSTWSSKVETTNGSIQRYVWEVRNVTSNNKRDSHTKKTLWTVFMSAIIRSRVTQYRLIIEDEVQAGGQALTHGLNSRPRQPGWLSYFCLFFPPLLLPMLRLRSTLIIGDANASLLFQSLSLTARHWLWNATGQTFFDSCKPISKSCLSIEFSFGDTCLTRNEAYVTTHDDSLHWNFFD